MFADNNGNRKQSDAPSTLKSLAVLLSLMMQLATCTVVFGFIGHLLANKLHHPYITAVGIIVGLAVGMSGFAYLAKHFLGEKP
jgi:Putative F0F1-ATPase subunit Ca2+/Mg2+ transporter